MTEDLQLLDGVDVYRIYPSRLEQRLHGKPTGRHRRHPDRWRRSWQAEWPDCQHAVRGWTRHGVLVQALRTRKHRR